MTSTKENTIINIKTQTMAINVTLGEAEHHTKKPFPKLMQGMYVPNFIVLFFNESFGICITSSGDYKLGEKYNRSSSNFTDYNIPITIQNA